MNDHHLLLVDDDLFILEGIGEDLASNGYHVTRASSGEAAVELLESNKFDLVITDLVMPFISGVGVISIIKKKYAGTPVIAITGWGEHPGALATEAQADIVLEKPIELPELDKLVSDLLAKKAR